MSSNLQRVGTTLLDMDGVATQLHIKGVLTGLDNETGEEQYSPFITVKDITMAGSDKALIQYLGVNSDGVPLPVSNVAVAYKEAGTSTVDRSTVRNAKYLDNKAPAYFFPAEDGINIDLTAKNMAERFNKEIADIKAEHIQLMSYIAKNGLTDNYRPFAGFYDTFRESYPLHKIERLGTAFVDSAAQNTIRVKTEEIGNFSEGDFVVIVNGDDITSKSHRTILKIDKISGTTITFDGYTGFDIKANKVHLYKSYGTSYGNSFVFGSFLEQAPGDAIFYTGVDDDNYRTRRKINTSHTGFATTFRVNPSRANGSAAYYLDTIEICAKKIGTPGALKCYVINAADISNFEDPEQAKTNGILIAESQPLILDVATGETIVEFKFEQNGVLPLLDNIDQGMDGDVGRTRFCMIVEAISADATNYYEILFLQHYDQTTGTLSDLQMNNIVYEYSLQPSLDLMSTDYFSPLVTSKTINSADMYYGVSLRPVIKSSLDPADKGVYSAAFKTYEPVTVNSARLTLRIAREGYYTVAATSANESDNVTDEGTIRYLENKSYRVTDEQTLVQNGMSIVSDNYEEGNRNIAIGNHITEVKNISGDKITISKGANIAEGDPVYPIGYIATLLCSCKKWDATKQQLVPVSPAIRIPLKLVSIQPAFFDREVNMIRDSIDNSTTLQPLQRSRLKDKVMISDNIIFEADIDNEKEYNCFELQIFWRTMASTVLKSFTGRIYDLSLSLNRKVFWDTTVSA